MLLAVPSTVVKDTQKNLFPQELSIELTNELISYNDTDNISEKERESLITRLMLKIGFEVEFVG